MSGPVPDPGHQEIQGLLGVYALDAVDPATARLVEEHLSDCLRCAAEVAQHHEVAGLLANSGGAAPDQVWDGIAARLDGPADGWDRLAARLGTEAARETSGPRPGAARLRRSGRQRWATAAAGLAAAAAAFVALVLGLQVGHLHSQVRALQATPHLSAAEQAAAADPSTLRIPLRASTGTRRAPPATVVLTADGTGFVVNGDLAALPADQTYQLWGVLDGRTVSLGLLGARPTVVPFSVAGGGAVRAFAITAERAGGVVQSTHQPVAAGVVRA